MKLKYLTAFLLSLTSFSYASSDNLIAIDKIKIGKISGNETSQNFSMMINFTNSSDENINNWQFGFYMPRSFDVMLSQDINPDLKMQICTLDGECKNLRYVKNNDIKAKDLSQGPLTILEPVGDFPLIAKQGYYIRLLNNNQGAVTNYSAFPQSFFIIDINKEKPEKNKFYAIASEMDNYELTEVNQSTIEDSINLRIKQNWESSALSDADKVNIVPLPRKVNDLVGQEFKLPTAKQRVFFDNQLSNIESDVLQQWATTLQKDWKLKTPVSLSMQDSAEYNDKTTITIDEISNPQQIANNPEGYVLTIDGQNITIEVLTTAGVSYAMQTLRQLYQNKAELPPMEIIDYPSLDYRGVMLDVARHYFTVAEIKQLIDVMASAKMNALHLHLSDDEAFRIALPDYPQLQNVAATRGLGQDIGATWLLQNNLDNTNLIQYKYPAANTAYSGHYTATDVKEIIAYANQNQITVIPEIDLPGHARALIKALPNEMIDHNDSTQTISVQGYHNNVLPVCTYGTDISVGAGFTKSINNIINQISTIFSNQATVYAMNHEISLGGDEVPSNSWSDSSSCTDDWNDFTTLKALDKSQLFFKKIAEHNSNLKISGWQQLVQEDNNGQIGKNALNANSVGHIWVWNSSKDGVGEAITLANSGYPTVLAFADKSYFDIAYNPSITEPGFTWSSKNMDTYNVLTMQQSISAVRSKVNQAGLIRGVEGTLWSENLPSADHLMYMALPRIPALSEVAWSSNFDKSNEKVNWQNFAERLGCGEEGYLAYVNRTFKVNYRGYPSGIQKEIPANTMCKDKPNEVEEGVSE